MKDADLIEWAWTIIANSSDWHRYSPDSEQWKEAAESWRDEYHKYLDRTVIGE